MKKIKKNHLVLLALGLTVSHTAQAAEQPQLSDRQRQRLDAAANVAYDAYLNKPTEKNLLRLLIPARNNDTLEYMISLAISEGHDDIVNFFLKKKPKMLRMRFSRDKTLLHIAAEQGNADLVDKLIGERADVDATTNEGCTAFHRACLNGQEKVCDALINAKSSVDALTNNDFTGLDLAARRGHSDIVRKLTGLMSQETVTNSVVALQTATKHGHTDVVTLLLNAKVDPKKETGDDKKTALHISAKYGDAVISRLLLGAQADVHAIMDEDTTPLTLAAQSGNIPTIKALIDAGADLQGSFAYNYAALKGKHLAAIYLLNKTIPLFDENDPDLQGISNDITKIISGLSEQSDKLLISQYQKIQAGIIGENHTNPEEKSDPAPTPKAVPVANPAAKAVSAPVVTLSPEIVALNTRLEQASRKARNQQALQLAEEQQARIAAKRVQAKAGKTPKVAHKEVKLLTQEKPQQEQKQESVTPVAKKTRFTPAERRKFKQAQALRTQQEAERKAIAKTHADMHDRIVLEAALFHELRARVPLAPATSNDALVTYQELERSREQREAANLELPSSYAQEAFWLEQNDATGGDGGPAAQ